MLTFFVMVTVMGLAHCRTTQSPPNPLVATEWNCTLDHAFSLTNANEFLQSAEGFEEGATVYVATCPTRFQVFTRTNGICRCSYTEELRALLEQECQIRIPAGAGPDEYDLLVPNLDRENLEDLYQRQSCFNVLPNYIADAYRNAGVVPLFFNETGCRCDWVAGVDQTIGQLAVPPVGARCDRLVDQNYSSPLVGSDEIGNWVDAFPFQMQRNLTVRNGGAVFGDGLLSLVSYRLMAYDFDNINLVATFETDDSTDSQLIFSNICLDSQFGDGGLVDVRYSPNRREYSVRFFGSNTVNCIASSPAGTQTIQLQYSNRSVSLLVNNVACDISSLNPATEDGRLHFNSICPMQLGGNVLTNINQADFGRNAEISNGFVGVFFRFMALSNCDSPPPFIQDRIQGARRT